MKAESEVVTVTGAGRLSAEDASSEGLAPLLQADAEEVNRRLAEHFATVTEAPPTLVTAIRYSVESRGKRLRPILVLWSCEACGGNRAAAWPAALAVECVHTFSLIHDDLPAIDNDDLRRGQPACHVRFGEATAILAGDALLAHAFEILTNEEINPTMAAAWVRELSAAAGAEGLIGGEVSDLAGESQPPDGELVAQIHSAKTARLIQAACQMGAIAAAASSQNAAALADYGHQLGLAFQATDDLLDLTGELTTMGKRVGKDAASGKQTYPRAVGMEAAREIPIVAARRAIDALAPLGGGGHQLASLARYVVLREA